MTVVVDYGVGNLFSLVGSFKALNENVIVSSDNKVIEAADRLVLPGVGAFGDAVKKLKSSDLFEIIKRFSRLKPVLGICLGMQLLFDKSYEYGENDGLGLIKGEVYPILPDLTVPLKVPHMGWNSLELVKDSPIFRYVNDGDYVYYVHSYYAKNCDESVIATSHYGVKITGAVQFGNIYGTQFHPEKSGDTGLKILKAFCEL